MAICIVNLGNEGLFRMVEETANFTYAKFKPTMDALDHLGVYWRVMPTNEYRIEVRAEYVIVKQFNMKTGPEWFQFPTNYKGDEFFFYPWELHVCDRGECSMERELARAVKQHLAFDPPKKEN